MEKKQEKEKIEDDKNSNFPRSKTYLIFQDQKHIQHL